MNREPLQFELEDIRHMNEWEVVTNLGSVSEALKELAEVESREDLEIIIEHMKLRRDLLRRLVRICGRFSDAGRRHEQEAKNCMSTLQFLIKGLPHFEERASS